MSVGDALTDREFERPSDTTLALGGIVLVAFLVRIYALGAESLWVDEIHSTRVVIDHGPAYILFVLPILDPHPPFYYEVLWLWTRFTGVTATGLRSLSVVASVASIPVLYWIARRLYDRRVGLLASLLFAFSPFYVWYARETRMYALMTLLALLSMWAMLTWLLDDDSWWAGPWKYGTVTTLLIYTHAFGALIPLAQNVYVALGLDPDAADREWYEGWTRVQIAVGVASIPWFFNLLGGMFGEGRFQGNVAWIPDVTPLTVWKVAGSYVGRTQPPASPNVRRSLWTVGGVDLSPIGELVTFAALALLVSLGVRYLRSRWSGEESADTDGEAADSDAETASDDADAGTEDGSTAGPDPEADRSESALCRFEPGVLLGCWLVVPLVAMYAASVLLTPLFFDRFTAAFGVAGVILAAYALVDLTDRAARVGFTDALGSPDRGTVAVAALCVLVLAVPLANLYTQPQKQQWEEAATVVEENADAGSLVVVTPVWANSTYQYYADRDDLEYGEMPTGAVRWQVAEVTGDHSSVWLVVGHHNATQTDQLMHSMGAINYERERHVSLTELDVYHFVQEDT